MILTLIFICLFIGIIAGIYAYSHDRSTITLMAKIIFYFCLFSFLGLLFVALFTSIPTPANEPLIPL